MCRIAVTAPLAKNLHKMASISLKLDRRRANVRGLYPIQFLLSSKGKVTTIGTGINILPEHWNGEVNKAVVPKFRLPAKRKPPATQVAGGRS